MNEVPEDVAHANADASKKHKSRLQTLIDEGHVRPARGRLADLPPPKPGPKSGPTLSQVLREMRNDERY